MDKLIGREYERKELDNCIRSNRSELVVIYGRRRVGKTFLVEQHFNKQFDFWYVGIHGLKSKEQLRRFAKVLKNYSGEKSYNFKDWFDAFDALEEYLSTLPADRKRLIFIDEMPWIDTGRSNFVIALENFWNGWAMSQENIMLIATGSATSWMRDKLVGNQGGLHARITCQIHIAPFSLYETEKYMENRNFPMDRYQLLQAYMLLGGVPYYYSLLDPAQSLAQNIDRLCFREDGKLRIEFDELYNSLFNNADIYLKVVKYLSSKKSGFTYSELSQDLNIEGSKLTKILKNLERCDFVERWSQYGNQKKKEIYRLIDFYTLFYYKFLENNLSKDEQWWTRNISSRSVSVWQGLTFELICLRHHKQVKKALGISGMSTSISAWRCDSNKEESIAGAQIDMIIERSDRMIHLCEMKFSEGEYRIDESYETTLRNRMQSFKYLTKTKKTLVHTFITTYGVANGLHKSIVHSEVKMNDLFEPA